MDELADSPPCSVRFHTGKKSSKPKSIDLRAVGPLLVINHVAFAGENRRVCFLSGYFTSFNVNQQNLGLLVIIWATFQAKMIQQNSIWKHLKATSCQQRVASHHAEKMCCLQSQTPHIPSVLRYDSATTGSIFGASYYTVEPQDHKVNYKLMWDLLIMQQQLWLKWDPDVNNSLIWGVNLFHNFFTSTSGEDITHWKAFSDSTVFHVVITSTSVVM